MQPERADARSAAGAVHAGDGDSDSDSAGDGAADDGTFDVAIVGFGPTGAVAAALLAQAGLTVFVCDRERGVYDKPRAIALDHEIMRVFQQLGLADAVSRWAEPFTPSEYFGVDGQLIKRMTMVAPPYPLGHTPSMVFSQPPVERLLREHVAAQPGVEVALGTTLIALQQDDHGVTLELRGVDGAADGRGAVRRLQARHLIGCDGASSTVRGLLGIELEDLAFDEPWLVVDVLVNERGLAKLPRTSVQYCEPERPCTLVIGPGNHRRWEISLKAGEDPQQVTTPAATWALLARWLTPDDGTLWRQAGYRFHALVATRWRSGRVFIAGDAAHQQPPFLGQGMCQGIRDAANLAWKLAAVRHGEVAGSAAGQLLDSYGDERQAHVRELTRRIKAIGAVIGERDVALARERDAQLLAECGGSVRDTPRQDVLPKLEAGCLSAHAGSGRGTIFPQPRIHVAAAGSDELAGIEAALPVLLDDHIGRGWWLVLDDQMAEAGAVLGAAHRQRCVVFDEEGSGGQQGDGGCSHGGSGAGGSTEIGSVGNGKGGSGRQAVVETVVEADGVVAAWMERHGCHAALVRPDGYVFGTAASAESVAELLAEQAAWLGAGADAETPTAAAQPAGEDARQHPTAAAAPAARL